MLRLGGLLVGGIVKSDKGEVMKIGYGLGTATALVFIFGILIGVFSAGSPVGLFLAIPVFLGVFFIIPAEAKDEDMGLNISLLTAAGIAGMIFFSAPIWDEGAYCSIQLNGSINGETWVRSGESICLKYGSWSWMNDLEKGLLVISSVIGLGGVGLFISFFILSRETEQQTFEIKQDRKKWEKKIKDEEKEALNLLDKIKNKTIDSNALFSLCLNRALKNTREYETTEPFFSLLFRVTTKNFGWRGDDGSWIYPPLGTYSTHESRDELFEGLQNIDFLPNKSLEDKLLQNIKKTISQLDFEKNYKDWNVYQSDYLRDLVYAKGVTKPLSFNYQVKEADITKIYKKFSVSLEKEKLKYLEDFFEDLRKKQISKLNKTVTKIREKEKVTPTNVDVYLKLSKILSLDPIKPSQQEAKSLLEEIKERCSVLKKTPALKKRLEDVNDYLDKVFD